MLNLDSIMQLIDRIKGYPTLQERLDLAVSNGISSLILGLVLLVICLKVNHKQRNLSFKALGVGSIILAMIARLSIGYTYDSPFWFIFIGVDLFFMTFLATMISRTFWKKDVDVLDRISLGLGMTTILGVALCVFHSNIPFNQTLANILVLLIGLSSIAYLWKNFNLADRKRSNSSWFFVTILMLAPFIPYVFSPAPPDADITSQSEMIGYLMQGQSLFHAETGFQNENYFIRYPAGLSALGYLYAQALNIRSSEVLLLLWLGSYLFFVLNLIKFAKKFQIPAVLVALCCLNPSVTALTGVHGGQAQEILSYGMGIAMINLFLSGNFLGAITVFSGSLLIHPIVGIMFAPIVVYYGIRELGKRRIKNLVFGSVISSLAGIYLIYLGSGESLYVSQPKQMLQLLTIKVFLVNIVGHVYQDSLGFPFFFLALPLLFVKKVKQPVGILALWFLGGVLIDGFFGQIDNSFKMGRFQGSFSTIGVWVLCAAMTLHCCGNFLSSKMHLKRTFLTLIMAMLWLKAFRGGFPLAPNSVFTSHSNIKMGRFIERELPNDSLMLNMRPPGDHDGFGFFARGDSLHHVFYSRIGIHQIKKGIVYPRSSRAMCFEPKAQDVSNCLRKKGFQYILLDARPKSKQFAETLPWTIVKNIDNTYLFKL